MTTVQTIEMAIGALTSLTYMCVKLPLTWKAGVTAIVVAILFAAVSAFSTWLFFSDIWLSMVLAGAAFYGLMLGVIAYGTVAVIFGAARSKA